MIGAFFLAIWDIFIKFLILVTGVFYLPYISNMTDAITWFVGLFGMFEGIFPIGTLLACITVLLLCHFYKFQINIILHTLFPMIPFFGKRIDLPKINGYDDFSQPYYQSIRRDEKNENGMGTFYLYKRKRK